MPNSKVINPPEMYKIKDILGKDDYIIPMYQRNFAWGDKEILQLLDDILDYQVKGQDNENYYLGSLVVYYQKYKDRYEVIDGQQRLTTITILASYLKTQILSIDNWYKGLNLQFECRDSSTEALKLLFNAQSPKQFLEDISKQDSLNRDIVNGYRVIYKNLDSKLNEKGVKISDFANYLFEHIKILRVEVPNHTNLNHYFEVMNNRGEQLEKHEILKARMLETIKDDKMASTILHNVWEATANMQKYIQTGFDPKLRKAIFGEEWDSFEPTDFANLYDIYTNYEKEKDDSNAFKIQVAQTDDEKTSIDVILASSTKFVSDDNEGKDTESERFGSVINFPNFLLHVLRVHTQEDVRLDDKALLEEFDKWLFKNIADEGSKNGSDLVKAFIYDLLKCKYLFDSYIIKREYQQDTDAWVLKSLKQSESGTSLTSYYANSFGKETNDNELQKSILMLLASFHVSIPTMNYKHWLNGALYWLYVQSDNNKRVEGEKYLDYLKDMANSFLFDRYLTDEESSYYKIVYGNNCIPQNKISELSKKCGEYKHLTYGRIKNNFVFNYLDYLIWQTKSGKGNESNEAIKKFEFSFRSSVEHFYSQNPDGYPSLDNDSCLHSFGNLCLITHSQNSSFSNKPPLEKLANIINKYLGSKLILSSKDQVPNLKMIELAMLLNKTQWNQDNQSVEVYKECLDRHEQEMLTLFVENQRNIVRPNENDKIIELS